MRGIYWQPLCHNAIALIFNSFRQILFVVSKNRRTFAVLIQKRKKYIVMTKAEIVSKVAKATGVEKAAVNAVVQSFIENVKDSLAKDEPVYLRGFGSFIVKQRAQKTARNILEETTMVIPAHKIPAFKPSKTFVEMVKDNDKDTIF